MDYSRLVDSRFNKQGNLLTRLVLASLKTKRSLYLPTKILKIYVEAFTGFSHVYHPDGLYNTLLSQGCVLQNGSHCVNDGQKVFSKDGGGSQESLIAQVQLKCQPAIMSSQWPHPTLFPMNVFLLRVNTVYLTFRAILIVVLPDTMPGKLGLKTEIFWSG